MPGSIVVGTQWGDEGKGKIVDWLSSEADVVVRFQGGHNAGHTLVIDGVTYKFVFLENGVVEEYEDGKKGEEHNLLGKPLMWGISKNGELYIDDQLINDIPFYTVNK